MRAGCLRAGEARRGLDGSGPKARRTARMRGAGRPRPRVRAGGGERQHRCEVGVHDAEQRAVGEVHREPGRAAPGASRDRAAEPVEVVIRRGERPLVEGLLERPHCPRRPPRRRPLSACAFGPRGGSRRSTVTGGSGAGKPMCDGSRSASRRARERGVNLLVYLIVRALFQPFFHVYFRMTRIGREHIPPRDP